MEIGRRKFLGLLAAAPLAAKIPVPKSRPKSVTVRFTTEKVLVLEPGWGIWIDKAAWEAVYFKKLAENRALFNIEKWK
jgi:hypothetical protein